MSQNKKDRKPRMESPRHARIGRIMTLVGYFGLLALIVNWFTWLAPPVNVPRSLVLAALAIPLLFPLRGIIHARRYTHQWVGFLSMLYFAIGVDVWYNHRDTNQIKSNQIKSNQFNSIQMLDRLTRHNKARVKHTTQIIKNTQTLTQG